jgi:hypothetical protein
VIGKAQVTEKIGTTARIVKLPLGFLSSQEIEPVQSALDRRPFSPPLLAECMLGVQCCHAMLAATIWGNAGADIDDRKMAKSFNCLRRIALRAAGWLH